MAVTLNREADVLRKMGELPPFSPVLNKVLASLADDRVSFLELGRLIEQDIVLAGNVLRLVNSAAYGRRGSVTTISHALSILGITKIRNVVLGLSIARIWSLPKTPQGWSQARFNLHSLAVAMIADQIAERQPVEFAEGAFISGLLHDFGKLLIALALPADFIEIRQLQQVCGEPWHECERKLIDHDHSYFSGLAVEKWNLPEPVQRAVSSHHDPQSISDGVLPLSLVIAAADELANLLGQTVFEDEPKGGDPTEPLNLVRLGDESGEFIERFSAEFQSFRSALG